MRKTSVLFTMILALIVSACGSDNNSRVTVEGYVTNSPIFDATVSVYSPEGDLLGTTVTDTNGYYTLENVPFYDNYTATAENGIMNNEEYPGTLTGVGTADSCNITPLTTVISELSVYDQIEYSNAKQKLYKWLNIEEDPFLAVRRGEPLENVSMDALHYAILSDSQGVDKWKEKVIGAFVRSVEPNPMWIETPGLLEGGVDNSSEEAQLVWNSVLSRDIGEDLRADLDMRITGENGRIKRVKLVYYRQQQDILNRDVFIHFISPQDVRNSTYLMQVKSGRFRQYAFQSAFRKIRKIIRDDYNLDFMNSGARDLVDSGFTYEDIAFYTLGTYSASDLSEIDYNGQEAYNLTIEKNDEYTSYSHISVTILKDSLSIAESVMYDKENPDTPVKRLTFSDFETIQGFKTPKKITMENLINNAKTEIEVVRAAYNQDLDPSIFTTRNMEK